MYIDMALHSHDDLVSYFCKRVITTKGKSKNRFHYTFLAEYLINLLSLLQRVYVNN